MAEWRTRLLELIRLLAITRTEHYVLRLDTILLVLQPVLLESKIKLAFLLGTTRSRILDQQ